MRRWLILAALLALLLAVAWWFFFISPRQGRIAQAKDDLVVAQQTADDLTRQIATLQAIRESEVEYLAGIGKLEALIPERPLLDEFIDDINELCNITGVRLLNLAPAMPVPITDSPLRQITVAATVDGDFFEVLGFLFGIRDMDRLVRVDSISISSGQDETGATSLSVSISMRLFTLADLVPVMVTPGDTTPESSTTIPPSTTAPSGEG